MNTSVIITTQDHLTDATQTKALTNVNPATADSDLKTFAQMTAALSKDTFVKAVRIDETDLNTTKEPRVNSFRAPIFQDGDTTANADISNLDEFNVDINQLTSARNGARWTFQFTYNGTKENFPFGGHVISDAADCTPNFTNYWGGADSNSYSTQFTVALHEKVARDITFTIVIPENDQYLELRKTWTVHFINPN